MAPGNADERRDAASSVSKDIGCIANELQVLSRGQLVKSSSLRDIALPVLVKSYRDRGGHHGW